MRVQPYRFNTLRIRSRGYLPHWEVDNSFYFVTYRTGDALSRDALERLQVEFRRLEHLVAGDREPTIVERAEIARLYGLALDRELDRGTGASHLRRSDLAALVVDNLLHFDGVRYDLRAWCVMPNHVHVVFFLTHGADLARVLWSWKSFTGKQAKKLLSLTHNFWQEEYFDRVIRDENDYRDTVRYVHDNPAKAGLREWRWVGVKQ